MRFKNRSDAGKKLAKLLSKYLKMDCVVYALPRGGVITGAEVAKTLACPLDLVITRKIGHPNLPEYAIAAVSEKGELVINPNEVAQINPDWFESEVEKEILEAKRRREKYLQGKQSILTKDKVAILVDDGVATGLTLQAAIKEIKKRDPKQIILAVPVIPMETAEQLQKEVDKLIALEITDHFLGSIGAYYDDFTQVTDEEVIRLLQSSMDT